MRKLLRRIHYLLNRRQMEQELEAEMAAHREMMPEDRRTAFGSTLRLREDTRQQWGWDWADSLRRDLSYAVRSLRRAPGFTATAVVVLALGIGVNLAGLAIFRAINRPPGVRDPHSLYHLSRVLKNGQGSAFPIGAVEFFAKYSNSLSPLLVETRNGPVVLEDDPKEVRSLFVSGNYFAALGLQPAYGRMLSEQDATPAAPAVAVIGYDLWETRFGGDAGVVGKSFRMNGRPVEIVGVAPHGFTGIAMGPFPVWLPVSTHAQLIAGSPKEGFADDGNRVYARLRTDVSQAAAEAELSSLMGELRKRYPKFVQDGERVRLDPFDAADANTIAAGAAFGVMLLLILITACANLGNMLLARGIVRQREIGIRLALGAGRGRVIRQLMTENLLLAGVAAAFSLLMGRFFARFTLQLMDAPPMQISIDGKVLAAAAGLALVSAMAFGLAPAIQSLRRGPQATRTRKVLVLVQVAASCVLLIATGVLGHGVARQLTPGVRFPYQRMLIVDPELSTHRLSHAVERQTLDDLAVRLSKLPGVEAVTTVLNPPWGWQAWTTRPTGSAQLLYVNQADPSYFDVLGLPLLAGRAFRIGEADTLVISESASRKLWPNETPLGKALEIATRRRTVVGVVGDSGVNRLSFPESVEIYMPFDGGRIEDAMLLLRTRIDPGPLLGPARAATSQPGMQTISYSLAWQYENHRQNMEQLAKLFGCMGGVATALAAIGIFGLVAFTVSQRTREIGVRMALGASRGAILRTVLAQYAWPMAAGALAGLATATWLVGFGKAQWEVFASLEVMDPAGLGVGLVVFVAIAAMAAMWPARRALGIDPSSALRHE